MCHAGRLCERFLCYNSAVMILVTGGTGFIGQVLIRHLVAMGQPVRTLLRPSPKSPNLPLGMAVDAAVSSLKDERGLLAAMKGVDVVYHLVGSERLGSRSDLTTVDVEGTEAVVRAAVQAGIDHIIFLSHLGADRASAYAVLKAKAIAEGLITQSGLNYTILRTAPVYGSNDHFTIPLARMLHLSPAFFLMPSDSGAQIQPIWVEDLVTCMTLVLDDAEARNRTYEIGGGEFFTFRQIIEILLKKLNLKRWLVPIPPAYLRVLALLVEQAAPRFPISVYWLDYLAADRTCPLNSLPRQFSLIPARFAHQLDYL